MAGAGDRDYGGGLRLAELLGALSLATDLAHQTPAETGLKDALMSVAFARHLGLTGQPLSDVYYLALTSHLGCTSYAEELGEVAAGDDASMRRAYAEADYADRPELLRLAVTEVASKSGPLDRVRVVARFVGAGRGLLLGGNTAVCEAAARLGERLGVAPGVTRALNEVLARWDGKVLGLPPGEGVSFISRITHLIRVAQIHAMGRGPGGAAEVVRRRRGGEFDPALADAFLEVYIDLFGGVEDGSVWDQALDAEPDPHRLVPQSHVDDLTLAIADFTDIKSPYTLGHSRRMGALAAKAAACSGLDVADQQLLRLAGHVHDLGNVSLPQRVWTKDGRLNRPELEAVHLHPYHAERILSSARALRPMGALAGLHHERLDGSGYHRGVAGAAQSQAARLLAVAEVYQSMLEERSWRPAHDAGASAKVLAAQVSDGALERAAVRATLEAAGQPAGRRQVGWPVGLTDREVEVLRLLAAGRSNRTIADSLHVSEATVRTHALKESPSARPRGLSLKEDEMSEVHKTATIDAPAGDLFDIVENPENLPKYVPNVSQVVNFVRTDRRVGDTFRVVYKVMGATFDEEFTTTEHDRPKRITSTFAGGMTGTFRWTFEPDGAKTRVTVDIEYRLAGGALGKAVDALMLERTNEKSIDGMLENLRRMAVKAAAPRNA